jgi:hypothetical protein
VIGRKGNEEGDGNERGRKKKIKGKGGRKVAIYE